MKHNFFLLEDRVLSSKKFYLWLSWHLPG